MNTGFMEDGISFTQYTGDYIFEQMWIWSCPMESLRISHLFCNKNKLLYSIKGCRESKQVFNECKHKVPPVWTVIFIIHNMFVLEKNNTWSKYTQQDLAYQNQGLKSSGDTATVNVRFWTSQDKRKGLVIFS